MTENDLLTTDAFRYLASGMKDREALAIVRHLAFNPPQAKHFEAFAKARLAEENGAPPGEVVRAIFRQILPGNPILVLVGFRDANDKELDDSVVGEWTADGEHECLELRLATGAEPASDVALDVGTAMEVAWMTHAEGICGQSGAVPEWFKKALQSYASHAGLIRLADVVPPRQTTGSFDLNGRELFVGDRVQNQNAGPHTKKEYWLPEYEIQLMPGGFRLKHVGGGLDGANHDFILRNAHHHLVRIDGPRPRNLVATYQGDSGEGASVTFKDAGEQYDVLQDMRHSLVISDAKHGGEMGKPVQVEPAWLPPQLEWHTTLSHGGDVLRAKFYDFEVSIPMRGTTDHYLDMRKATAQAEFDKWCHELLDRLGIKKPASDDWIKWEGGPCPVDKAAKVDIRWHRPMAGVTELHRQEAGAWDWGHGYQTKIVGYRLSK